MAAAPAGPTTSAQALSQEEQFQGSMQTPEQQLQQAQQNLGTTAAQQQVTGLRQAINNTTTLLGNVAPSVMGRTGNSLETTAQANAEISNEQAPLNTQLNSESTDYTNANSDYQNLEQQAETEANSDETASENKLGYLQNIYQALYGQEQSAAAAKTAAAQEAEQTREYNTTLAEQEREANLSSSSSAMASPTYGGTTAATPAASSGTSAKGLQAEQRSGGGYDFTANGKTINALQYAQASGENIRSVLSTMAAHGDSGAKLGLTFIGNDGNADPTKVTTQALANLYTALTGRRVAVYSPPAPARNYASTNALGQAFKL